MKLSLKKIASLGGGYRRISRLILTIPGSTPGGLTVDALWAHCTDGSTYASPEAGGGEQKYAVTTPLTAGRKLKSVGTTS